MTFVDLNMQRRRTETILAMVPPADSGDSSEDDEPEIIIDLNGNKCESPLPDEVDENEIDNLLQEIELNPFEEVYFSIIYILFIYYIYYIQLLLFYILLFILSIIINVIFYSLCLILEIKILMA